MKDYPSESWKLEYFKQITRVNAFIQQRHKKEKEIKQNETNLSVEEAEINMEKN